MLKDYNGVIILKERKNPVMKMSATSAINKKITLIRNILSKKNIREKATAKNKIGIMRDNIIPAPIVIVSAMPKNNPMPPQRKLISVLRNVFMFSFLFQLEFFFEIKRVPVISAARTNTTMFFSAKLFFHWLQNERFLKHH